MVISISRLFTDNMVFNIAKDGSFPNKIVTLHNPQTQTSSYLGNNSEEDGDPFAHGGGGAVEVLAAEALAASGR